jgi:hypothetical protein
VAYTLNASNDGFPVRELPGLALLEVGYKQHWRFAFGFASCVVLDSDGQLPLGFITSAQSLLPERVSLFCAFLSTSLQRFQAIAAIRCAAASRQPGAAAAELSRIVASIHAEIRQQTALVGPLQLAGLESLLQPCPPSLSA